MASYFFLRGQEKVTKKKATPPSPAFGFPNLNLNLPGGLAAKMFEARSP